MTAQGDGTLQEFMQSKKSQILISDIFANSIIASLQMKKWGLRETPKVHNSSLWELNHKPEHTAFITMTTCALGPCPIMVAPENRILKPA